MNSIELLQDLSTQGMKLWVQDGQLRYRAPKEVITPSLLAKIKEHKGEIISLLREDTHKDVETCPLSYGQLGLWFIYQLAPENAAYNIPFAMRIYSRLDIAALRHSFQALVNRHPTLRTTFTEKDDKPIQVIHNHQEVCFEQIDSSAWSSNELNERVVKMYKRPFDLKTGPLLRVTLFTRSAQDHVLLLTIHHMVCDGWSLWVLLDELQSLYTAKTTNKPFSPPLIKQQYTDYVKRQTAMLASSEGEQLYAYWQKQLSGDLSLLNLPTDHPRPPVQTYRGASHDFTLPEALTGKIKALAQAEEVTLYTVLVAAFQVLLYHYTSQEDILVGSPTAGRDEADTARTVGYFVNPIVLRANLSGNPTFKTFLGQVRHTVLSAILHQEYPFPLLVEKLQPNRDPSRSPIFQAEFVFQKSQQLENSLAMHHLLMADETAPQQEWAGLKVVPFPTARDEGQFDLTLEMLEAQGSLFGAFKYNVDLFDAATIARMAGHFQKLLEAIVTTPEQRISEFSLLTAPEHQQMLVAWNDTKAAYPQASFLHQLFEAQVKQTPDAVAVMFQDQKLTYQELDLLANQLAHRLQQLGVKPETLVAIYVDRSLEMVVGLLGVLKAGGAYLPLDPTHPQDRLAFILEDAHIAALLTQHHLLDNLPEHQAPVICLNAVRETIVESGPVAVDNRATTDSLAYVIYTSGSTGKPKGVQVTHRSVVNFLNAMRQQPGLTNQDILLSVTTLSFDIANLELFLPLINGATLVLVSSDTAADGTQLQVQMAKSGTTLMQATPATWRLLLEAGWEGDAHLRILCGGEAFPRDLAQQLIKRSAVVWNMYGPTETTIWSAIYQTRSEDTLVPIGRPIANTQMYLLDKFLNPVPVGVPGELYIGGDGLARGYLNRPRLTSEKFVPNPFSTTLGERLYRTGDLVRYLPDGNLEFLGRIDHQVKIHGFRIELGEIEAVLVTHPAVHEVVVLDQDAADMPGNKQLVAYIVPHDGEMPTVGDLRHFLGQKLPNYMVPASFVLLTAFPLTPNGKINRRALPLLETSRLASGKTFVAPRTPVEEGVAKIWAEALGLEQVGIYDEFFELGGDSFRAMRILVQIRQTFKLELNLGTLFKSTTVAALADVIAQRTAVAVEPESVAAALPAVIPDPDRRYEPFPLTDVQQAYWIGRSGGIELSNVATHAYLEFEHVGLDVARLEWAWQQVVNRHDMLRAVVRPDGQQQILAEVPPYRIKVLDLRGQDSKMAGMQLEAVRQELSHQMLPSDQWPLFDIRVSLLDDQCARLHVSLDFLIIDAWSIQLIGRELARLYQAPEVGLAPLTVSFRDYVLAEQNLHKFELYQRSLVYWQGRLPTLPPAPELPLAKSPEVLQQPLFVRREAQLAAETWRRLKTRATRIGLTPSGVLLAAFAEVLTVWSKNPHFTINLTLFNRLPLHAQVNDMVGDFTSLTMFEVNSLVRDEFEARARRIQEQLWQDLDHRYVSGVHVMREWVRERGGAPGAVMPVVFTSTLIQAAAKAASPSDEDASQEASLLNLGESIYTITQTPQVWLDHQVAEQNGALVFAWDAVEALFPAGLLDEMFAAYCGLLERLAAEPEAWTQSTADLLPLPAAQAAQRQAVNDTQGEVSRELLHTLFNAQAGQRPGATAVVSGEQRLSYESLQRYSRQVGHWLRQQGAAPNSLVAVVMEKGWEQVAAVLGVMQAGAAYLPIAADLPAERLNYLLEHGQVQCILTQSHLDRQLSWAPGYPRLCVDGDLSGLETTPLAPVQGPEDLAYVIYTSGSTGLPKGVAIDHRGAVNTIVDLNQRFKVGPEDRVLALSALNFDLSVYDIFGTLAAGGTVVIPEEGARRDPGHWARLLAQEQVSVWNSVPALMEMLVEYLHGQAAALPASLRLVWLSGDWIPLSLPDQIKTLAPGAEVVSMGGATEASIWSILYPIDSVAPHWSSIPYGRPMRNQSFHVLDEGLAPRPVWVPGQLYIGGIGLAQGYWRDEEKTAASFVRHPRTGERLYRTGDLGRYLPDGNIEFLGREDFQVKIRGHRIELGEIEAALAQHPAVRTSLVMAVSERCDDTKLVAYIIPEQTQLSAGSEQNVSFHSLPEAYEPDQSEKVMHDPIERLQFKLSQPGLRQKGKSDQQVPLVKPTLDADLLGSYIRRRSYRKFLPEPIPMEQFSYFLSSLLQVELDGSPLPKYQYGSAGGLYPVQTYLYIRPGRVEGLAAGIYYYDPKDHNLITISTDDHLDRTVYGAANQAIFDESAFSLFFVGKLDAITPMYGERARDFCMLEAGLMTQLLEMIAPIYRLGLCQIGGLDFEQIQPMFALPDNHILLHSLLGGRISRDQANQWSSEQQSYIESVSKRPSGSSSVEQNGTIAHELQSFLEAKLPEYMIPAAFITLDTLPLTSNGKVDRKALLEQNAPQLEPETTYEPPQTEMEQSLATIVKEVLHLDKAGIHDDMFALGATSIDIVRIHRRVRETLNKDIAITEIFKYRSISSLAARLNEEQKEQIDFQKSYDRAEARRATRDQRRKHRRA